MPSWVLVALALQVLVPLIATLVSPIPSRFGFHMYSREEHVSIDIRDTAGTPIEFDDSLVAKLRPELRWTDDLPEFLCSRVPRAAEVTVSVPGDTRSVLCSR